MIPNVYEQPGYVELQLPEQRRAFIRGWEACLEGVPRDSWGQAQALSTEYEAGWDAAKAMHETAHATAPGGAVAVMGT